MQPYLIYILLLGAVVFVGAVIMPRKQQQAAMPEQAVQNMENALEQFMENMEKDHAELIQLIAKSQRAAEAEGAQKEQRIAELERKYRELERQIAQIQVGALAPPAPVAAHIPAPQPVVQQQVESPPPPAAPETIQSRYADLFGLYNQGKSIEMISKKLGMNKGEVQLVLQLAKQEAAANG